MESLLSKSTTTHSVDSLRALHALPYSGYTIKWASLAWEISEAQALRRRVFCEEQQLFESDDLDVLDHVNTKQRAITLVALGSLCGWHEEVVALSLIHI